MFSLYLKRIKLVLK